MRNLKLVLVDWHDSRGVGASWSRISDVKDDGICKMQSVGWLVKKTKKHICIMPHVGIEDDGDDQGCGEMHIPRSCIDSIVALKPPHD